MSGGHFSYLDTRLRDEIYGFRDEWTRAKLPNAFEDREISALIYDVLCLIHEFDWYICGDTDEEDYLKAKAEFKERWLDRPQTERVKMLIDESLQEVRDELYWTYGITGGTE